MLHLALALVMLCLGACTASGPFDVDGTPAEPLASHDRASVLIFTRSDCPIANRYAPELARLHAEYAPQNVRFWLVYPDDREDRDAVQAHSRAFGIPYTPLLDPGHVLVDRVGATISPEAAVFDAEDRLVYRGRIDDRFPALGITRDPQERDLERAIDAALDETAHELVTTSAVGCYLSDLP